MVLKVIVKFEPAHRGDPLRLVTEIDWPCVKKAFSKKNKQKNDVEIKGSMRLFFVAPINVNRPRHFVQTWLQRMQSTIKISLSESVMLG